MYSLYSLKNLWYRKRRDNKLRELRYLKTERVRNKEIRNKFLMTLPKNIKFTYIYNTKLNLVVIYVYDRLYSFVFTLEKDKLYTLKYYKSTNCIYACFYGRYIFFEFGQSFIYKIIRIFYTMFTKRLRVRGRLYRIYKRNIYRDLQYRFGHAHFMTVFTPGVYVKYIRKKRIRIWGFDFFAVSAIARKARDVFPMNIYTGRGIRIGGERQYSKIGKAVKWY